MTAAAGWIIDTDVSADRTLRRMGRLATTALRDPAVIHAANQVIAGVPSRDFVAQIGAIEEFLNSSFYFVPNPLGTQTVRPPGWTGRADAPGMLEDIERRGMTQGSCADASVLIATLAMANGIPARFRAIAFCVLLEGACDPTEAYTHVITDLSDGRQWYELDVTRPHDRERLTAGEIARTLALELTGATL